MGLDNSNSDIKMDMELEVEVEVEVDDNALTDSELAEFVRNTLEVVKEGESLLYNDLVGVINTTDYLQPIEVGKIVTSLKALSRVVPIIDLKQHESLIYSIFGMSMWNYGPDVMDAMKELFCYMVAYGKFVDLCLVTLVSSLVPPHSFLPILKQPRGIAKKDLVFSKVHAAMSDICQLSPCAPSRLSELIRWKMPVKDGKEPIIVVYVESMLRLEGGLFEDFCGNGMLPAVVERLVDLDVDIEWEEILQDDTSKGLFDMELGDSDETQGHPEKDTFEISNGGQNLKGNVVAEKLDSLMLLTFDHIKLCFEHGRKIKVFQTLLGSFVKTVLNVHKSKFTQFVMFYACALDPENCGVIFSERLADIFLCKTEMTYPSSTRMNAVSYLASYLSRGRFLSSSIVANILKRLVDWCFNYCKVHGGKDKVITPKLHGVFYAGCQAIMYILCFRMRLLMEVPGLKAQLLQMPWESILGHRLDPLKLCTPSIVEEFLRQAKAAQLCSLSQEFLTSSFHLDLSRTHGGMERLDTFFPFDPILLKKCDKYIRPHYVYWSMVKTTYDDDEVSSDEDDKGSSDEEDDVDEENGDELDDFENCMNKMSITPRKNCMKYRRGMPATIRPSTSPLSL